MEAELRPAGKTMMCGGWCRSSQDDGTNVKVYGFDQASPKARAVQASPDPPELN